MPVFMIYTFKDPDLLERVVDRLSPHPVVVHVDAKINEAPFRDATAKFGARVHFIERPELVNWAGWSQVVAIRKMVTVALSIASSEDDYAILLSGSDYPIRPIPELCNFLAENPQRQYLHAFAIRDGDPQYARHIYRRHHRDLAILRRQTLAPTTRRARNALIHAVDRISWLGPAPEVPPGLVVAHGGTHFALTVGCLRALEAMVTPEMERFFAHTFCPEEKFYHSLLATKKDNKWDWHVEPFRGVGQRHYANLHYIDPTLVKVFTDRDWDEVKAHGDRFFLRKLDSVKSAALLARIDRELLGV